MKLIYQVEDKPKFGQLVVFAIQQLLAIMTATLVVPVIISGTYYSDAANTIEKFNVSMSPAAALFGAGVGTLIYVLFTAKKSPVFLGSSFAFLGSMGAAFTGAATMELGFLGLIVGAILAGLVYVVIAILVKVVGVKWVDKLMPAVVIGPTVAIIGLSLAGNAVGDIVKGAVTGDIVTHEAKEVEGVWQVVEGTGSTVLASPLIALLCGLVTLTVTMLCSTYGKKMGKLIPFIFGILAGYVTSLVFTLIGNAADIDVLKVMSFDAFKNLTADGVGVNTFVSVPEFSFMKAVKGFGDIDLGYIGTVAVAYLPVAFVVFAEHIADHKNISSIIERDLLKEPGLDKTLLGDGVGSMVGAVFGGCPNTTYGESIGCVAITKNASVYTIITAAVGAILISFLSPFVAFVNSIPPCVMGGVCMALYGFIAVSGLKMVQSVDLNKNKNLFVVSVILIAGIGGLTLNFGQIQVTEVAVALILGILTNLLLKNSPDEE